MAEKKKLSDSLRQASFRGVPFHVETTELGAGRRTQLHEYPKRDKPDVEDLGRATRDLSFSGFVVGDDYVEQANTLLGALEAYGPGTLVHPWFGTMQVSIKDAARVSFDAELGKARFAMSFIESGELEFPSVSTSTQAASRNAASELESVAVAGFADRFTVSGFQDFVAAAANGNLGDMLGVISSSEVGNVLGLSNSLATSISTAIALISNPATLGWKLLGMFGLSGVATTVAAWTSTARSLTRVAASSDLSNPSTPTVSTASRQQAYVNAVAINTLARQALLAQAVGASSLVGTSVDSTLLSYDDMVAVRAELIAAIDAESMTASDSVYDALQTARLVVWQDLTSRASDSARLTTVSVSDVMPALVLAYDYYEDAIREAEIVARNGIQHPGFIPAESIKVLTR